MEKAHYLYDVFISHAVEDKIPIANELCRRLEEKKLKVWYSGNELSVGDRLTESIHKSLDQCRFGVVIISPTYLSKIWALSEFFFLLRKEKDDHKVILPVLYDITPQELASRSTLMAEMFAVRADKGMDHVIEKLYAEIQRQLAKDAVTVRPGIRTLASKKHLAIAVLTILVLIAGIIITISYFKNRPGQHLVEHVIQQRITGMQKQALEELQEMIKSPIGKVASASEINGAGFYFSDSRTLYSNNEYTLYTSLQTFHSKKDLDKAASLRDESLTALNLYNLTTADAYRAFQLSRSDHKETLFFYSNESVTVPAEQSDDPAEHENALARNDHPIRMVSATHLPPGPDDVRRPNVTIRNLHPVDTYTLVNKSGQWMLESDQ